MRSITRVAAIVGASVFVVPAVAAADSLPVQVGGEVAGKPWIDLQGIYPKKPAVHVGDTIDFSMVGFHTIAVQPTGVDVLSVIVPTVPAAKFPVTNDAAGNPFWWGGVVDALSFNGAIFAPTATTFDGTALVHSGGPSPTPFSVTFTQAGTFVLACEIHPFMRGNLKVVAAGGDEDAVRPFARQVKKGAKELRKDARAAQKLDRNLARNKTHGDRKTGKLGRKHGHDGDEGHHGKKHKARKGVVLAGAGTKRFSLLRFYPGETTVKAGDSVTWKWTGFNEVHTVTFGPDDVLTGLAASLFAGPTIDPVGGLPTEAPGAPVVHSATVHGNGLLGAGIVPDPGHNPPNTGTVRFTTPGDFNYVCLIHAGMAGVVHVTA
jgi:plastocyanin